MSELHIYYINAVKPSLTTPEASLMSFSELIYLIKSRNIIKQIMKWDSVIFHVPNIKCCTYPFIFMLACRLMARQRCVWVAIGGSEYRINFWTLLKEFGMALYERLTYKAAVKKIAADVAALKKRETAPALNFARPPLYLRSDFAYGWEAGGSVGHIAGVLNNLGSFFAESPILLSSDQIPTIDKDIHFRLLHGSLKFCNVNNVPGIFFSDVCYQAASSALTDQAISMIYQRSALNSYCGVKLAHDFNVPLVLEYNGSEVWTAKNWGSGRRLSAVWLSEEIENKTLAAADLIVCVSEPLKAGLMERGIAAEKILVNPNGVNERLYHPDIDGGPVRAKYGLNGKTVIGFIGTFGPWHGAEVLARAFAELAPERDDAVLLLIGDGVRLPATRRILEEAGVMERCILTGVAPQEKGPEYLAACDILVSPQTRNSDGTPFFGSPTKLFEYMAMGKAIVASDLGQIGEVIQPGQTGLLVEPGDAGELRRAILRLIDDSGRRAALGRGAREYVVKNHTWKSHTEKIITALKNICGTA